MKVYELNYHDYEDYRFYKFTHTTKFFAEFQQDCVDILKSNGHELLETDGFIGICELVELIAEHLPQKGYSEFKYESFGFSGSGILREYNHGETEDEATRYLADGILDKIFKHNEGVL